MEKRKYYSARTGKNKNYSHFNLDVLKKLFLDIYREFSDEGYFQQAFGYDCIDNNFVCGTLGENIKDRIYRILRKEIEWPITEYSLIFSSEDDVFDIIEFLYDYVAKPIKTPDAYHQFGGCGWHYSRFNKKAGQKEFLTKINEVLIDYGNGFEIDINGRILIKDDIGLSNIYSANIPTTNKNIKIKVDLSVQKFRESRSNIEDRRIAIRELADVLEILRPEAKLYLDRKDEDDLFNIANNFSIRHTNDKQKIDYDRDIWYSWMFYFYLATIQVLLRIKERKGNKNN